MVLCVVFVQMVVVLVLIEVVVVVVLFAIRMCVCGFANGSGICVVLCYAPYRKAAAADNDDVVGNIGVQCLDTRRSHM